MREIVFSIDIETNGDAPGISSMLSLGCVAVDPQEYRICDRFLVNLDRLPNDYQTEGNKAFWAKFPEQYEATRQHTVPPGVAMDVFRNWVITTCSKFPWQNENGKSQDAVPVALAYPGSWDYGTYIYWYFTRFLGEGSSPFKHQAMDLRTMIADVTGLPYKQAHITAVPKEWMPPNRQKRVEKAEKLGDRSLAAVHNALVDAEEQAIIYLAVLKRMKEIRADAAEWRKLKRQLQNVA